MKDTRKDKLIKQLLGLLVLQANKFNAFDYLESEKEPQKLGLKKVETLIKEELTKIQNGQIKDPLNHMINFVRDNIGKYDEKTFMGYLCGQASKDGIMSEDHLKLIFRQYKPFLSESMKNKIDPPTAKPRGRPPGSTNKVKRISK